ncbi:hypothetical protein [Nitrosomonas sp. H1_AOB3]|uniref:hypothetical protein n=1 Tax=Nitrosomonas sp. H1_AOB3 TaxID=2741553 RepID=UPI00193838D6|nr:hypothetical protein [Nitrosomonas sp. H1_AOB3]QOJ08464.1 MAG: hypothetical protein HRU73_02565 [Nitrosomonas sp. H1_AOB3]
MDASVIAPIVAALAALGGVALTAFVQARNQVRNQAFLAAMEVERHLRKQQALDQAEMLKRLVVMHKIVSKIEREFSITNLVILLQANTTKAGYDARYLEICGEADELTALAHLYEPAIYDEVERMNGQMNMFWGNFKQVLYQRANGEVTGHQSPALTGAHAAAREVATLGRAVKYHLSQRMRRVRNDC